MQNWKNNCQTSKTNNYDPEKVANLIEEKINDDILSRLKGLQNYQNFDLKEYNREQITLWNKNNIRLLSVDDVASNNIILLIPSLINRYYILDLMKDHSFLQYLKENGLSPLVVDWGTPGQIEQSYSLSDYINVLIEITVLLEQNYPSKKIHLLGYCMGGNLALALSILKENLFKSLILISTPWDFHAAYPHLKKYLYLFQPIYHLTADFYGYIPTDIIQMMFFYLNPKLPHHKFVYFNKLIEEKNLDKARSFVALEDWLNDGIPLSKKVAIECFDFWLLKNDLYHEKWKINDTVISPKKITENCLIVASENDYIVPKESITPLINSIEKRDVIYPQQGHIGIMASQRAKESVWKDLVKWIRKNQ